MHYRRFMLPKHKERRNGGDIPQKRDPPVLQVPYNGHNDLFRYAARRILSVNGEVDLQSVSRFADSLFAEAASDEMPRSHQVKLAETLFYA